MGDAEKNVAGSPLREFELEPEFFMLQAANPGTQPIRVERMADRQFLQLHFCLKGQARFLYNQGRYTMEIQGDQSMVLYNPRTPLDIQCDLSPDTWLVSILMTIRKFHSLFTSEASYIPFLSPENRDKKYYQHYPTSPGISVVLSQLWNEHTHPSARLLYSRAKVYELLSLYFNRNPESDSEQCPFLVDEENIRRIRLAKEIIIQRMAEPPGLQELADEIGLSLKKLKEGFRQIYGDSVYSFLFDYKMETARKMLETGKFNVNEVGLKVGYSTASHFIAAFRKKYNTTPKKYTLSLARQRS
jgi:AraC-like DNA-binding protein